MPLHNEFINAMRDSVFAQRNTVVHSCTVVLNFELFVIKCHTNLDYLKLHF